jgi:hypothetical protein
VDPEVSNNAGQKADGVGMQRAASFCLSRIAEIGRSLLSMVATRIVLIRCLVAEIHEMAGVYELTRVA